MAILFTLLTSITFSVTWIIPESVLSLRVQNILKLDAPPIAQEISLYIREHLNLSDSNTYDNAVRWVSSDEHIATVDGTGKVSALFEGNTEICLLTERGRTLITWELSVISPKMDFSTEVWDLCVGDINSLTYVTYLSGLDLIWNSSNPAIATVDGSGKLMR